MEQGKFWDTVKVHDVQFIDLRFTDTIGKEQHISIPIAAVNEELLTYGKMIDGSSIRGWKTINQSDLMLSPDLSTMYIDPFYQDSTLIIRCNVTDPQHKTPYERDPRYIAMKAEAHLRQTGIAEQVLMGPELEFFLFDDVRWETKINSCFYAVDSAEAHWNSGVKIDGGNIGHRPRIKGGYFPVPPVDSSQDIRSTISQTLAGLGMLVEAHHHEVATGNQCEVATRYDTLVNKADQTQLLKYVIHNVAHNYGKTATFMPKPLVGDNGSGMHCHISLATTDRNLFAGDVYAGLSEEALFFIGGIIQHARALNVFTNPSINSYRRLLPGFEAPVLLAYSACNRSAAIRIPYVLNPKATRIEVRFPDPTANPYLAFSALLMAGLDGIQHKIHPGEAIDKDLYDLPLAELGNIPKVSTSLEEALASLRQDHAFLLHGNVFTLDYLDSYMRLKEEELAQMRQMVHPYEFELYYSL